MDSLTSNGICRVICLLSNCPQGFFNGGDNYPDDWGYGGSDGNYYVGDTMWHSDHRPHVPYKSLKIAFYLDRVTADALAFSGRAAMVGGGAQPAVADSLMMPAEVIGGGTIEIQLNIIATMILGLPRS